MNSRDLCLIDKLNDLAQAGVASFKIEGRMKNEHYVGGVVNAYKRAMNGDNFDYWNELEKLPHRPYTTGFTFNDKLKEFDKSAASVSDYLIIAVVIEDENKNILIKVKNKITTGDEIEILSPSVSNGKTFIFSDETVNVPGQIAAIDCPHRLESCDILRKKTR